MGGVPAPTISEYPLPHENRSIRRHQRQLIQELPGITDNAVCFHDKDGTHVAFLLSPHGLAKMLTDAAIPEPDGEEKKLLRQDG